MLYGIGPAELFAVVLPLIIANVLPWVLFVVLCILAIRWFLRQERAGKDPQSVAVRRSLAEVLRSHRERCKMTQEFVAEKIGVSRQAVSKWEQGASEPSTTNLVKLARLYGVDPADLLREVEG
ncbi:helix-turn-helix domain-containing protein [Thermophilibacter provencensis]|uniref:Helix-turn-helix transcriptional regulator n=1 Tax=Thermophilibacter provencensis TaxID=1852386 RepID=A0ABT7V3R0_9ACTN|nr:helix-turn-helix transcriptional regulator [Thermophilibacter provencensis]MDM8271242.1 helix-turn-helix transcriptional regulator [Thermophilibacter provencensis]